MQSHAAVFREGDTLKKGCDVMDGIYTEMNDLKVSIYSAVLFYVQHVSRWGSWSNLEDLVMGG